MKRYTQFVIIAILLSSAFVNSAAKFFKSAANNQYFIQPANKYTWKEALKECESKNMDLLTIENEIKANEIKGLLKKIFTGKRMPRLYLGANDLDKFREFTWISSKSRTPFTYTNWEKTEPNNYRKLNERCIHIGFHGTEMWNDINCSRKYGFICQERLDLQSLIEQISKA